MFSHVIVGSSDLHAASIFYDAILLPLGLKRRAVVPDGGPDAVCWVSDSSVLPRFYVMMPFNRQPANAGNGSMVAFTAPSAAVVDAAYAAGMAAGGSNEGPPGPRPQYAAGYYGAYLRDPDGNKVHITYRGDLVLATEAVVPE